MSSRPTFIVIGAQKAATTSVFQWLREHPDVYLPAQKELEFFSNDRLYERGFGFYCDRWFRETGAAKAIGEVSPQYMMSGATPARIAENLPDVQLIAVLRNPIDRAYSHYVMSLRRGLEKKSFEEAIDTLVMKPHSVPMQLDELSYLEAGLYGRILGEFRKFFSEHSLRVVFYETLIQDPEGCLENLCRFIGVDAAFIPQNIGTVFNRGSSLKRFPRFESWMMKQKNLKRLVKAIVPHEHLSKFLFWFDTEMNVFRTKSTHASGPTPVARERLRHYYREDVRKLETLLGCEVPWTELRSSNVDRKRPLHA